jgi:hypothetical protein
MDTTPPPGCSAGTSRIGTQFPSSLYAAKTELNKNDGTGTAVGGGDWVGDVNGDGLADALWTETVSVNPLTFAYHAELNRGDGTSADDPGFGPAPINGFFSGPFADLNGDGQLDRVRIHTLLPGAALNKGYSAGAMGDAWVAASSEWTTTEGVLIDVNGDGLLDLAKDGPQVRLNRGSIPDLLTAVETPYGGRTTIAWTTSANTIDTAVSFFPNSNAANVGFLPIVKPIVKAIEVDDAEGHVSRTEYAYVRGVFDPVAREFLGFERVTQTVGTSNGAGGFFSQEARVETKFLQTVAQAGLPYETTVSDAENVAGAWLYYPRKSTLVTYGTGTLARLPIRIAERRSEQASVIPTIFQRTCVLLAYDSTTGSPTQIDHLGLVTSDLCADDTSDTVRSTSLAYATGGAVRNAEADRPASGAATGRGAARDAAVLRRPRVRRRRVGPADAGRADERLDRAAARDDDGGVRCQGARALRDEPARERGPSLPGQRNPAHPLRPGPPGLRRRAAE